MAEKRWTARLWEDSDYIVCFDGSPVGMAVSKGEATMAARWLNENSTVPASELAQAREERDAMKRGRDYATAMRDKDLADVIELRNALNRVKRWAEEHGGRYELRFSNARDEILSLLSGSEDRGERLLIDTDYEAGGPITEEDAQKAIERIYDQPGYPEDRGEQPTIMGIPLVVDDRVPNPPGYIIVPSGVDPEEFMEAYAEDRGEHTRSEAEMWRNSSRLQTKRFLGALARVRELGDYDFDPDEQTRSGLSEGGVEPHTSHCDDSAPLAESPESRCSYPCCNPPTDPADLCPVHGES